MSKSTPCDIPILILAAGQSSRMRGRDKLMEVVGGAPLIRRQADLARLATVGPVLVTLPPGPNARRDALKGCDVQIVPVPDAAEGLSASLRRGLLAVPHKATEAMVLLADLPELTSDDLRTVCAAVDPDGRALIRRGATSDGKPGHPIVFSKVLFGDLCAQKGDAGGSSVAAAHMDRTVLVPLANQRARRDLDTPEDWAAWRAQE